MKNFIKENWFKIAILLILVVALCSAFFINYKKPIIENSKIVSTFVKDGNIFIKYDNGKEKQVTFSGSDNQPSLSNDFKKIVFLRNIPGKAYTNEFNSNGIKFPGLVGNDNNGDYVNLSQIFILDLISMGEQKIFNSGVIKDKYITNGATFTNIFDIISNISHPILSLDNKKVYFMSSAWVTSAAIFSVDINTGQITFIGDGNSLDIIREGALAGNLLILKHKYFGDIGGSYDHYFVVDDNGKEIKDVGDFDKTPVEIFSNLK